jgi:hypothetical protein
MLFDKGMKVSLGRRQSLKSTHSTPRSEARGMLSLPPGRQGLILSGAFYPGLKTGVRRHRKYQSSLRLKD